jgi:uncharacterized alkaline shock family protein YloU
VAQILNTGLGAIQIADETLATLAGMAATECFGLVGMVSRSRMRDNLVELLGRENLAKGVLVESTPAGVNINLYVIVAYGVRISEVATNIMEKVKYTIESLSGLHVDQVNVNVQGVRVNQTE